jgi:hypothetical protein
MDIKCGEQNARNAKRRAVAAGRFGGYRYAELGQIG